MPSQLPTRDDKQETLKEFIEKFGTPKLNDSERTIRVGKIATGFADAFCSRVKEITESGEGWVLVYVDSVGGNPEEALTAMERVRQEIDPTKNALAAFGTRVFSAAIFIFLQCDYRVGFHGFLLLIHAPVIKTDNVTKGSLVSHEAKENWREAARLRALVEKEVPILVRCSNGKMQEGSAHSMLSREGGDRYLNMSQAKARGFLELDHYSPLPEYAKNLQPIGQQLDHIGQIQLLEKAADSAQSQGPFTLDHALLGKNFHVIVGAPVVYNVGLSKFHSPHLTINVQGSSESDHYLRQLMYSIGTDLGTLARTRRLRRVRQGPFTLDHALLDKKFHVMPILRNILMSNQMVKTTLTEDPDVIQVKEQSELASRDMVEKFRLDVKHPEEDAHEPDDCLYLHWGRDYEK